MNSSKEGWRASQAERTKCQSSLAGGNMKCIEGLREARVNGFAVPKERVRPHRASSTFV
jgi:hypothetical protein